MTFMLKSIKLLFEPSKHNFDTYLRTYINEQNQDGDTALHIALRKDNSNVINPLLENHATIKGPLNKLNQRPIDLISNRKIFGVILPTAVINNDIEAIALLRTIGNEKLKYKKNKVVLLAIDKARSLNQTNFIQQLEHLLTK